MVKEIKLSEIVKFKREHWPPERQARASARVGWEYSGDLMEELYKKCGRDGVRSIEVAMAELADKYFLRTVRNFNIEGSDTIIAAACFKLAGNIVWDEDADVIEESPQKSVLRWSKCPLFTKPDKVEGGSEICQAFHNYQRRSCELLNPNMRTAVTKTRSKGDSYCELEIELTGAKEMVGRVAEMAKLDEIRYPLLKKLEAASRSAWECYGRLMEVASRICAEDGLEAIENQMRRAADKNFLKAMKTFNIPLLKDDTRAIAAYFALVDRIVWGQEVIIVEESKKKTIMRSPTHCIVFPEAPMRCSEEARAACIAASAHERRACEILNPKLRFTSTRMLSGGDPYCEGIFWLRD